MHKIHLFFCCLVTLGLAATDLPGYSATPLQYCTGPDDWSDHHDKIESASECASLCDDALLCVGFNYCDGSSPICADGFEYHQLCVLATFMDCHDRLESNDWTFYEKEVDIPFESTSPSTGPSVSPSTGPSVSPSPRPSVSPSVNPSSRPSARPSNAPSAGPSTFPSTSPTKFPVHNLAVCGKGRDYSECVKSGNVCDDHPFANHHQCEKGCLCPDGLYLTKDDKCVKESDCPVKEDTEVVCDQDAADNWKDLVTRLKSSGLRRRRLDNVDDVFEDLIEMMNDGGILNVNY